MEPLAHESAPIYRVKVDENLPTEVADVLRAAGHEADTVHDERLDGQPDDHLWNVCRAESRALVTLDLDWSDMRRYVPEDGYGIILLRGVQAKEEILTLMDRVIADLAWRPLHGRLWIVTAKRVRSR